MTKLRASAHARRSRMRRPGARGALAASCALACLSICRAEDWPQLQHDARHTGYTPAEINAPGGFKVGWRVDFPKLDPPEHVYRTVQVIAYDGRLFVPTQEGSLFALDPATGKTLWRFHCGEGVMHTAGAEDGRVFFATIKGSVFAVDVGTGKELWRWRSGRRVGFSSAVLLVDGKIFIGGRMGDFHALSQADGKEIWKHDVPAPIYQTAAYNEGRVYFAAEDMHCYCLSAKDGELLWKSRKLSGMSFRDFHPLVHGGVVILEAQPAWKGHGGAHHIGGWKFPVTTWWTVTNEQAEWITKHGPAIGQGKIPPEAMKDFLAAQDNQVKMFKENPEEMLRFAVDEKTGEEPFILPCWIQSMCGPQPPPVVCRDDTLAMPVSFGRGTWGRLDIKTQRLVDIFFDVGKVKGDRYEAGAGGGNGDENMSLSAAGPLIFAVHWQEGNAQYTGFFDLDTRKWSHLPSGVPAWGSWGRGKPAGHNAQLGNNAASIAYGAVYHQAFNVVHNWVPK